MLIDLLYVLLYSLYLYGTVPYSYCSPMTFGQKKQQQRQQESTVWQHEQQQLLYQYRCLNCGTILKETDVPIDSTMLFYTLPQRKERCISCDNLLQEQTIDQIVIYPSYRRQQLQENHQNSNSSNVPSLTTTAPIFEIAYDIGSPRLTFDIPKLDSLLLSSYLVDSCAICITSNNSDSSGEGGHRRKQNNSDYFYYSELANLLATRLCVRALMSKKQGGFESPAVVFVDAGNCSDIYQCVNFARQYGMDIDNMLNRIIVSRPFTINQLAALIINELEEMVFRFSIKLVIISDILKLFNQEPQKQLQLNSDEAKWLMKEIVHSANFLLIQ